MSIWPKCCEDFGNVDVQIRSWGPKKLWPFLRFRGPILVPEVGFWGFWGQFVLKSGLRILILKMAFWRPESKFWDHFSIQISPQNPPKSHLRNQNWPSKTQKWPSKMQKRPKLLWPPMDDFNFYVFSMYSSRRIREGITLALYIFLSWRKFTHSLTFLQKKALTTL